MLANRRFPLRMVLRFSSVSVTGGATWAALIYTLYQLTEWQWMRVPFLPIATVGTAVAFYVGFKNNSAYDRFWEGRKIWGGIVNESRSFANFALNHIGAGDDSEPMRQARQRIVYRHLAWINALRLQLRRTSRFFHKPHPATKRRLDNHAEHMRNDWDKELAPFLDAEELSAVSQHANSATHLLMTQGKELTALQNAGKIDLFHQIQLMDVVRELYALQGKAERIKATPFPRQYAEYSRLFTRLFAVLLPFGLLDVFAEHVNAAGSVGTSWAPIVPMLISSGLVTWVFITMEGIGDASEDPFERSMNDVPMNALCRVIEIDLRQLLGETDVPGKEQPIDGVLY